MEGELKWMESEDASEWPGQNGVPIPSAEEMTFGAIIAVAELVDCIGVGDLPGELRGHPFAAGPWCWVFDGARRIEPVPCKGAQLVWSTDAI